jgi:hypothetical protein
MYFPTVGAGDAATDEGTSGTTNQYYEDSYEVVLSGNVPMVDGASFGLGYATADTTVTSRGDREEGTAYVNYSYGPVTLGAQVGVVAFDIKTQTAAAADVAWYKNTYYGISYAINDNLSVSYQNNESQKHTKTDGTDIEDGSLGTSVLQESDGFSVAYTLGGMTISYVDNNHDNESYGSTSKDYRQIVIGVAF